MHIEIMIWQAMKQGNKNDCSEAPVIANATDQHITWHRSQLKLTTIYTVNDMNLLPT